MSDVVYATVGHGASEPPATSSYDGLESSAQISRTTRHRQCEFKLLANLNCYLYFCFVFIFIYFSIVYFSVSLYYILLLITCFR